MTKRVPETVRHPFPPLFDASSRVLILGSLPSVASRQAYFYYMHPRNRFWAVMSALLGTDLVSATIEEKKRILLSHGIALHDVVSSCRIVGSGDASIRDVVYTDVPAILARSEIKAIFLNGTKAYSLFLRGFPQYSDMAFLLPSTSPANAARSLAELTEEWGKALKLN